MINLQIDFNKPKEMCLFISLLQININIVLSDTNGDTFYMKFARRVIFLSLFLA